MEQNPQKSRGESDGTPTRKSVKTSSSTSQKKLPWDPELVEDPWGYLLDRWKHRQRKLQKRKSK